MERHWAVLPVLVLCLHATAVARSMTERLHYVKGTKHFTSGMDKIRPDNIPKSVSSNTLRLQQNSFELYIFFVYLHKQCKGLFVFGKLSPTPRRRMRSGGIATSFFYLAARWTWVVIFRSPAALPWDRSPITNCIGD
jgi:hypothetical protein